MTDSARLDASEAAYRGFLFSDMRGFTAFAERHGNAAAAAAVGRFLDMARSAIARYGGSEINTEGDAIHAVFPSASSAVMCGLDIVDAAAELNAQEPGRPIGLGVGVHAGEAVETADGYIGRAVNIAARLCAAARPGEVLVSSTVKGITQASIPVGFIRKGNRRLKGIEDPILVYAVTRDMTAKAPRVVPRRLVLAGAGSAGIVALVVAVLAGMQLLGTAGVSEKPTEAPATTPAGPQPVVVGPLSIGSYRSEAFTPTLTFSIVDQGWTANRDLPDLLSLVRDDAPRGGLAFMRVLEVIENPCVEGGDPAGTRPADALTELETREFVEVTDVAPVTVGGVTGRQADITVSEGAQAACGGLAGGEIAIFRIGEEVWRTAPGERFRVISLVIGEQPVTIVMGTDWSRTPSVQELERVLQLGQRILDGVSF